MLGKVVHYTFDAILISTVLAGIRRSTGLGVKVDKAGQGEVRSFLMSYLGIGEYVFDAAIVILSRSSYFERKR